VTVEFGGIGTTDLLENVWFGVDCPGDARAVGGGGVNADTSANMSGSGPTEQNASGLSPDLADDGETPTGWAIRYRSGSDPYSATDEVQVWAVCVS
jgi:hypothetical protein